MPSVRLPSRQLATYGRKRKSPERTADTLSGEVRPNFLSGNVLDTPHNLHISVKPCQMPLNASNRRHSVIIVMCVFRHCQPSNTEISADSCAISITLYASQHHHAPRRTSRSSSTYRSMHTNRASGTSSSHSPHIRISKAIPITFVGQRYRTAAACDDDTTTTAWRIK